VDFHDAGPHAGEAGCVSGRLVKVFASRGGNTFLDFCEDYRDCPFTSVIFSSDKKKFGDLESLVGRQIEIRGTITVYQGKPEVIIREPEQIRLAH
jgi:DNA/RNA endonuclease YhcR with UshA esterase domain